MPTGRTPGRQAELDGAGVVGEVDLDGVDDPGEMEVCGGGPAGVLGCSLDGTPRGVSHAVSTSDAPIAASNPRTHPLASLRRGDPARGAALMSFSPWRRLYDARVVTLLQWLRQGGRFLPILDALYKTGMYVIVTVCKRGFEIRLIVGVDAQRPRNCASAVSVERWRCDRPEQPDNRRCYQRLAGNRDRSQNDRRQLEIRPSWPQFLQDHSIKGEKGPG